MTPTAEQPRTAALAQWYGSNRMLADHVGRALAGCAWVGVPFAGGMSELRCITARTLVVNDLHKAIINCARVTAHPTLGPALYRRLKRKAFHPAELAAAQERCARREELSDDPDSLFASGLPDPRFEGPDVEWAADYFTTAWMSRAGDAGTDNEYRGGLALRWTAGGGDSAVRFRSATASLVAWRRILRRATFSSVDAFDFLAECKDRAGHAIYSDPPWPDAGDCYRHKFDEGQQRRLAGVLGAFKETRVVIRYGDHPLVRELYPADRWTWLEIGGRTQANKAARDVLIVNGAAEGGDHAA